MIPRTKGESAAISADETEARIAANAASAGDSRQSASDCEVGPLFLVLRDLDVLLVLTFNDWTSELQVDCSKRLNRQRV